MELNVNGLTTKCASLDETKPRTRRTGVVLAVALTAWLLAVGFFYVWTRMHLVQLGYEVSALEKEHEALNKRKTELLLEISSIQSPIELEKQAKERAGLIFPAIDKVVHVP